MYYGEYPAYVVMFSARAFLSMAACVVVFLGLWFMEHKWDEEGSEEYDRAQGREARTGGLTTTTHADYTAAPTEGGQLVKTAAQIPDTTDMILVGPVDGVYGTDHVSNTSSTSSKKHQALVTSSSSPDAKVPLALLKKAHPQPTWVFAGFVLLAFSGFLHPEHGLYISVWNVFSFVLLLIFGGLFFPLRKATIKRDFGLKKRVISSMVMVGFWLAIAVMSEKRTSAPWPFCAFGGECFFWKCSLARWRVATSSRSSTLGRLDTRGVYIFFFSHPVWG
jgi:hypothetical protein